MAEQLVIVADLRRLAVTPVLTPAAALQYAPKDPHGVLRQFDVSQNAVVFVCPGAHPCPVGKNPTRQDLPQKGGVWRPINLAGPVSRSVSVLLPEGFALAPTDGLPGS